MKPISPHIKAIKRDYKSERLIRGVIACVIAFLIFMLSGALSEIMLKKQIKVGAYQNEQFIFVAISLVFVLFGVVSFLTPTKQEIADEVTKRLHDGGGGAS